MTSAPEAHKTAGVLARRHAIELEQCSLFIDSPHLRKAMTDAAAFLQTLSTPSVPAVDELSGDGLPQSAASGAERELRAALERIVNPIGFMQKQADATGFKLDGHMAMTLSNDANYLKRIAQKALDALPASGDGPDAGHAAARSSSTQAVEQEVEITDEMVTAFYEATEVTREGSILRIKDGLRAALAPSLSGKEEGR